MPKEMQSEIQELHAQFKTIFPVASQSSGVMLMRLVPSRKLLVKSYRRYVNDVLIFD